ncbi:sp110 nuclear body protein-like isoform X3 [Ictalurus furcatus]|uniref:sp110 nuclear body protein-like isoform X3 n=1 Tax=Ictalurus furcatus TaxID=66913 RepID=UPI002350590C|nr:sp110 nuclear body protein-like isoform X3 [Ictalurus furcatus]
MLNCKLWVVLLYYDLLFSHFTVESTGSNPQSRRTPCPNNPLDQANDDACFICNEEGVLVHCKECPLAFHRRCHLPIPQDETSRDNWKCTFCVLKANQQLQMQMRRKEILNSPVSENKLDAEWGSVISEPMWLDKVRTKLLDHEYSTVGEFVCDINLIFKNCQALNKVRHKCRLILYYVYLLLCNLKYLNIYQNNLTRSQKTKVKKPLIANYS